MTQLSRKVNCGDCALNFIVAVNVNIDAPPSDSTIRWTQWREDVLVGAGFYRYMYVLRTA